MAGYTPSPEQALKNKDKGQASAIEALRLEVVKEGQHD